MEKIMGGESWGIGESQEFSFECTDVRQVCKMLRWSCEQAVGCALQISCQATGVPVMWAPTPEWDHEMASADRAELRSKGSVLGELPRQREILFTSVFPSA